MGGLVPVDLGKIFFKIKKGKAIMLSVQILDPMYMYMDSLMSRKQISIRFEFFPAC